MRVINFGVCYPGMHSHKGNTHFGSRVRQVLQNKGSTSVRQMDQAVITTRVIHILEHGQDRYKYNVQEISTFRHTDQAGIASRVIHI